MDGSDIKDHQDGDMPKNLGVSKAGWMWKKGGRTRRWQRRFFVLRGDILEYFEEAEDQLPKGYISLAGGSVELADKSKKANKFAFSISSPAQSRVYQVYVEALTEREDWVGKLRHAISFHEEGDTSAPAAEASAVSAAMFNMDADRLKAIGISSKFAQWRAPLSVKPLIDSSSNKRLYVCRLHPDLHTRNTSAFTVHNAVNCIATGTSNGRNSEVQIVRVSSTRSDFLVVHKFLQQAGCTSFSWFDDKLLCGATNGKAYLYRCHAAAMIQPAGNTITENNLIATFVHPHLPASVRPPPAANNDVTASFRERDRDKPAQHPLYLSPDAYCPSAHVRRVAINPMDPDRTFVSLANDYFYVWNMGTNHKPSIAEKGSSQPLFAVEWNPHSGHEFVIGGENRSLKMLDIRQLNSKSDKCVVWKVPVAHEYAVRDIAWNPLVPHWIATAGEDGCARIWDIRFGSQATRVLSGHTNTVTRVRWSRSRVETLVTSSLDGTLRLWNLRVQPHCQMHCLSDPFSASVVGCDFSSVNSLQYSGCSANGELVSVEMEPEFLSDYVLHRPFADSPPQPQSQAPAPPSGTAAAPGSAFSPRAAMEMSGCLTALSPFFTGLSTSPLGNAPAALTGAAYSAPASATSSAPPPSATADPKQWRQLTQAANSNEQAEAEELKEIERLLYLRDISTAISRIARLANVFWETGRHDRLGAVLKLCSPANFENATKAQVKSFSKLLGDLSYFVPANALQLTKVDARDQEMIQMLKVRLALQTFVSEGNYKDIFALEKEILQHLPASNDSFTATTLENLVISLLPHDYLRTLELCIRIGHKLKQGNFSNFTGVARILFYPSIYDSVDPAFVLDPAQARVAKFALERDLRNPKLVLSQLELLHRAHAAANERKDAAKAIIALMEQQDHRKILPSALHRLYFNALLQTKKFDVLYVVSHKLAEALQPFEFGAVINSLLDDVTFPRLRSFLDTFLLRDERAPWATERKTAAALTLVNILCNCEYIPPATLANLPHYLTRFTEELAVALSEMRRNRAYEPKGLNGTADAKQVAEQVVAQIQNVRDNANIGARSKPVLHDELIQKLVDTLNTFIGSGPGAAAEEGERSA